MEINSVTMSSTQHHFSQEDAVPPKKSTKKRSWVWDWIEQDPVNKYRAVCVYCQDEIFRLDGDRGSPKKLISHVSSHHGINGDNHSSETMINLRAEKLLKYIEDKGQLITNQADAVDLGLYRKRKAHEADLDESSSGNEKRPRGSEQFSPTDSSLAQSTSYKTSPEANEAGEDTMSRTFGSFSFAGQAIRSPSQSESSEIIDPSIQEEETKARQEAQLRRSVRVEQYNDMIYAHNIQAEQFNKNIHLHRTDERMYRMKYVLTEDTVNAVELAVSEFVRDNIGSFKNLLFIESDSFRKLVKTIQENPHDGI